jgi:hypothetical protein
MKKLIAYDLNNKADEFIRGLRTDGFEVASEGHVYSKKKGSYTLGFFDKGYFFVRPTNGMSETDVSERSKLIKIAEDFGMKGDAIID